MQTTAQGWLVLELTNSPALLGVTSAAGAAPILFLSIFAGVLADRVDRRRLLIGTQLGGAALAAILAVLTATGTVQFGHVVALALLGGALQALTIPTFQAIVSTVVDREAIGSAVALNSAQFNLSRIIGPTIAGVVIAAGGLALAFWANALGLLAVAAVLATIRLPAAGAMSRVESSLWSNLIDGLRYVRSQPTLSVLVGLAGVPALFVLNYLVLMPVYARDILGIGAAGLGLLTAAVGIGALVGAVGVAIARPSGGNSRLMLAGLAAASGSVMVFAISRSLIVSLAALAVLGACQVAYYATANTLIQLLVPGRLRGRVLSLYVLASIGIMPLGNLLAGAVAERWGATVALAGGGLLTLMVVVAVWLAFPALRTLDPARQSAAATHAPASSSGSGT